MTVMVTRTFDRDQRKIKDKKILQETVRVIEAIKLLSSINPSSKYLKVEGIQ